MNIIIDAMGPEQGPEVIIEGIKLIGRNITGDVHFILVGDSSFINKYSDELDSIDISYEIVHTVNNITMDDLPSNALRNKDESSIAKGLEITSMRDDSAFISMGNTGAVMAFSLKKLGRIKGIKRPAIGTVFPMGNHPLMLDMGATSDSSPEMIYQFALMGAEYAHASMDKEDPLIGLLSIGEEETKGSKIIQSAYEMISNDETLNFYGNIEGDDIFKDKVDVIVTDGFTGNIIIKFAEGMASYIKDSIKSIYNKSFSAKIGLGLAKPAMTGFFRQLSYDEYGGAPLLGVNGITIIGHGKSNAKAVSSAIMNALHLIENDFTGHLKHRIETRS